MLAKENGSISVTYWAVVNPDLTNYGSQTGNPGIGMHFFFLRAKLYGRCEFSLSEFTGKILSL